MKRLIKKAFVNSMSIEDFLYFMYHTDIYTFTETVDMYGDINDEIEDWFKNRIYHANESRDEEVGYYGYDLEIDVSKKDAKDFIEGLWEELCPSEKDIQDFLNLMKEEKYNEAQEQFNISEPILNIIDIKNCMDFKANTVISKIKKELLSSESIEKMYDDIYEHLEYIDRELD